jgi:hypothetical protein
MQPSIRPPVYETYWTFAAERQAIFHRRVRGEPWPWTEDSILKRFKFCNVYRASDRVSQYLIQRVIYEPWARDLPAEDVFLRVVLFRLFSKEQTWEALEGKTGGVRAATLDTQVLGDLLEEMRRQHPIYTAAFILSAHDIYGQRAKHRNHLALVEHMFRRGGLGSQLARARSLEGVYQALLAWPLIGPFLAYQLSIDLNYTDHLAFSEDDFTAPGPGALRGLKKVFSDFGGLSPRQLIMRMVDSQEEEVDRLGIRFQDLFGRRLHAIDCQGLFCEVDKYSRQAFPELKSNRVRIKQGFRPAGQLQKLFYPPKWGINDRLGRELSVTSNASQTPEPYIGVGEQLTILPTSDQPGLSQPRIATAESVSPEARL